MAKKLDNPGIVNLLREYHYARNKALEDAVATVLQILLPPLWYERFHDGDKWVLAEFCIKVWIETDEADGQEYFCGTKGYPKQAGITRTPIDFG